VGFLKRFNSNIAIYSDDGKIFHAPYGYRLRKEFGFDQFEHVIRILKADPDSRRAVLQIWHCELDLVKESKDIPCNDLMMCKIRDGKLNITVCNRSNDIIWGCYGANVVQFSVIQEYLAAMLDVGIGEYRQISDSYHAYTDNPQWGKLCANNHQHPISYDTHFPKHFKLVDDPETFDAELARWFNDPIATSFAYNNRIFPDVATPMFNAWCAHKVNKDGCEHARTIQAADWSYACVCWLAKRGDYHV